MSGFQLDTSGSVAHLAPNGDPVIVGGIRWSDLTPFAQGYIAALFQHRHLERDEDQPVTTGFSDLAPATLARIIGDCETGLADPLCAFMNHPESGAMFWRDRQANQLNGMHPHFPPLTPYLGDDGLIYLREAA